MDKNTRTNLDTLHFQDGAVPYKGFNYGLETADERVDWAHPMWDDSGEHLHHENWR
jgi:hypothetical protein